MYVGEEEERITFVIPVRNLYDEAIYDRALSGLRAYQKLDADVLISDYGSIDKTKQLVKQFGFDYLYTEPNEGEEFNYCKCANHGIAEAKTKYICSLGIDWIFKETIPQMVINKFKNDYKIIVRATANELKKEDKRLIIHQIFYRRIHALFSQGYDERFNEWGNEDNDFMKRILEINNLKKVGLGSGTHVRHITHPYHWRKFLLAPSNRLWLHDNTRNSHKNIVNSYWSNYLYRMKIELDKEPIKKEKPYKCG